MNWSEDTAEPIPENLSPDSVDAAGLFPGDSGSLPFEVRRVLCQLLAGPSVDAERHALLWPVLLREETALAPDGFWATSFCEQFYRASADAVELVPAFVARVADDALPRLNSEHSAFRWERLDAAAELVPFGSQRELLAHVRREFVEREPSPFLRLALD